MVSIDNLTQYDKKKKNTHQYEILSVQHFPLYFSLYDPSGFLMFSGGRERVTYELKRKEIFTVYHCKTPVGSCL